MHPDLINYLTELRQRYPMLQFPDFCPQYSGCIDNKRILAVLSNPGQVEQCSINNDDPTSENQRSVILEQLCIPLECILFWNFYPYKNQRELHENHTMRINKATRQMWAKELRKLAVLLKNLRVIVACGADVREGMKYWKPIENEEIINVPSPGPRAFNNPEYRRRYVEGWTRAAKIAQC